MGLQFKWLFIEPFLVTVNGLSSCSMDSLVGTCKLSCPMVCGILVHPSRDQSHVPGIGRQILHPGATREVPIQCF